MIIWDAAGARSFIDKVRAAVQPAGWEVALTGSVFWNGESAKDLDLILYPHHVEVWLYRSCRRVDLMIMS